MRFELKAVKDGEGVTSLSLEAINDIDAVLQAKSLGYTVLTVKQKQSLAKWFSLRSSGFPLVLFTQELLALLDAGLNLVEAIETLTEKEHRPESKKVLERIIRSLYEGQSLSSALQQFPSVFPALYVATVRASEKTGDLNESLARYVAYQSQVEMVRKKIVSASIYPVLLIIAGTLVTLFLMGYVVPRFSSVYEGLGSDLPWFSRLLLNWGQMVEANAAGVVLGVAALGAGLVYGASHPSVKQWLGVKLWRIPAVGERMRIYQLARFYRTVGMLLKGGTPIVTALGMVSGLLQPALRDQLRLASQDIREGRSISKSLERRGLTTPVAVRMLRVGERTGKMGSMMERIAAFYEEEMARWVEWFVRLFEPLLMAFIGLVIGIIVILMYLPIFELAGSIK